jgi:uncharacterized protein YunC (DUF1805 family)
MRRTIMSGQAITSATVGIPESDLPRVTDRVIETPVGRAVGHSARWEGGQYCAIITRKGLIGCGAYHVPTMQHFGQAVAIARGTPQNPLCEPEDLYGAKIVEATEQAQALGVRIGDTGLQALQKLLAAERG